MKKLILLLIVVSSSEILAQKAPEFPNLELNQFTDKGYIDKNGTLHTMLIKKPNPIYASKKNLFFENPPNIDLSDIFKDKLKEEDDN